MSRKHPHARNGFKCPCFLILSTSRLVSDAAWRLFIEQHWAADEAAWLRSLSPNLDRLQM
jgi:hypothetical protein